MTSLIQCSKCFKEKPNEEFGDFKTCIGCRDKNKLYLRDYRKTHKKNYCKKSKEEVKSYMINYYQMNRDKLKQRSKDHYNNKKIQFSNTSDKPVVIAVK